MPFFQDIKQTDPDLIIAAKQDTLQVRKPKRSKDKRTLYQEKRVWVSTSLNLYVHGRGRITTQKSLAGASGIAEIRLPIRRQTSIVKEKEAAVSVEAALALSIFIFAMVCMMVPFRMMERQRQVQAALESVNEELCQYAYLEYMLSRGEEIPKEEGDQKKELLLGLVNGVAGAKAQSKAEEMFSQEGMTSHSFSRSAFLEDGETVHFCMDYEMRMPFSILGLDAVAFSSQSTRRAWIGRDGLERDGSGSKEEEDDPIVYIGKTSTRYHLSRDCHYLSNKLKAVSYDSIDGYRNQSGGHYHPCAVCGSSAHAGSLVYIMESGSRYHTDANCTAIIAYVQEVRLSEVEHMGACSYCGR